MENQSAIRNISHALQHGLLKMLSPSPEFCPLHTPSILAEFSPRLGLSLKSRPQGRTEHPNQRLSHPAPDLHHAPVILPRWIQFSYL